MPCLAKSDYKQAWDSIADAIGAGFCCLEPAYVKEVVDTSLVPCLGNADYKRNWYSIACAIRKGLSRLEPAYLKEFVDQTVLPCLANADDKRAWWSVVSVFCDDFSYLEPADVKEFVDQTLLPCLANTEYKDSWPRIVDVIGGGLTRLEPTQVKKRVYESLVPCLANIDYKQAWPTIARAIRTGLTSLAPADVKEVMDQTLLPYMANVDFKPIWEKITIVIIANGQVLSGNQAHVLDQVFAATPYYGVIIVSAAPKLRWFVRRIGDDLVPKRIVYGVCERNSPELLFDPELQAAPDSIKQLCGPAVISPATEWLRASQITDAIASALREELGNVAANAFKKYIGTGRKQSDNLRPIVQQIEDRLAPAQRSAFRRPVEAKGKPRKKKSQRNAAEHSKSWLFVHPAVLKEALTNRDILVMLAKAADSQEHDDWVLVNKFVKPRYCCPSCGALHVPKSPSRPKPERCAACRHPFREGDHLQDYRGKVLICRQSDPPIEFAVLAPQGQWRHPARKPMGKAKIEKPGDCPACWKVDDHFLVRMDDASSD